MSSTATSSSASISKQRQYYEQELAQKTEREAFDSKVTDAILKEHNRGSVYDLKEEDFARLKAASTKVEESKEHEDLDEFYEEIGDIDPKKLIEINQQFREDMLNAEADTFWCLSKLIDDIQDNYTDLQPGVHKIINKMKALIQQADPDVLKHLEDLEIDFITFAYRWVSCYLTREFDIYQTIRIWDTYFSEDEGFSQFHCYVCAALFLHFSKDLMQMGFQDALMFLQNLPTRQWDDDKLTVLLAEGYQMKELYHYNQHLVNQKIESKQLQDDNPQIKS